VAEFDSVIPAGGTGKLTARIKTASTQQGRISKSVNVTSDAPGAQRITLGITLNAVPVILVLPHARVSLGGIYGEKPTSTVILRSGDGEPFEVTGVETGDPSLRVTATAVAEAGNVNQQEVRPGDVILTAAIGSITPRTAALNLNGVIKVRTTHPDANVVDVPYSIRIRPVIEARPGQLRLLVEEGNATGGTTLFRVQHNRNEKFEVTALTSSNPEIFTAKGVDGDEAQPVHTIAVMLVDGLNPGSFDSRIMASLIVKTDDKQQPEVSVPVIIEPRQARQKTSRPLP
jgi:hypothetical protein